MTPEDVYKEMRIRGHHYGGVFRNITRSSTTGSRGHIAWRKDWIAFMDNMLQMKIFGTDRRGILVPTFIKKVVIDANAHLAQIDSENLNNGECTLVTC